jgi:nucleoside-diphosphate-sugar epimerase
VYYVLDTELSLCRDFFIELSEALKWPRPRRAGPYRWAWICARLGLSSLHPTEVIRRGRTSSFDMSHAKQDLGYEPPVTRQQGMEELADWYQRTQ